MKVSIFHASAGYGHQRIAEVIAECFRARGLKPEEVVVEDALHKSAFYFRALYPATYFYSVKYLPDVWGWFYETSDNARVYRALRPLRQAFNAFHGRRLLKEVLQAQPDVIVCTHFFSAEVFSRARREGKIKSKIIVVITDFYPHTFWVNEGTDTYWVMSKEGSDELKKRGVPSEKIQVGGIPVHPQFQTSGRKKEILKKWGFEANRFTLLLTSGSFGLGPQAAILRELAFFSDRIQCFVVCGRNEALYKSLKDSLYTFPVKIFGFVDFMHELMEASDLLIAKSGGSTTAESLAKGIPMVVLDPIPGQETRNAHLLKERTAAFFMRRPEQIQTILQAIFDQPDLLNAKRKVIHELAKPHAREELVSFVLREVSR